MVLKLLIVVVFLAILVSLGFGVRFLLHDDSRSRRLLMSLKIRVSLALLLLALLFYGFYFGDLAAS